MQKRKLRFKVEKWMIPIGASFKTTAMMGFVLKKAEELTGYKFKVTGKWGDFIVTRTH